MFLGHLIERESWPVFFREYFDYVSWSNTLADSVLVDDAYFVIHAMKKGDADAYGQVVRDFLCLHLNQCGRLVAC